MALAPLMERGDAGWRQSSPPSKFQGTNKSIWMICQGSNWIIILGRRPYFLIGNLDFLQIWHWLTYWRTFASLKLIITSFLGHHPLLRNTTLAKQSLHLCLKGTIQPARSRWIVWMYLAVFDDCKDLFFHQNQISLQFAVH
jgi:hypothetical protein